MQPIKITIVSSFFFFKLANTFICHCDNSFLGANYNGQIWGYWVFFIIVATPLYALSLLHVNISVSVNELNIKDTRSLVQVSFFFFLLFHADPLSLATVTMTTGQELK